MWGYIMDEIYGLTLDIENTQNIHQLKAKTRLKAYAEIKMIIDVLKATKEIKKGSKVSLWKNVDGTKWYNIETATVR